MSIVGDKTRRTDLNWIQGKWEVKQEKLPQEPPPTKNPQ